MPRTAGLDSQISAIVDACRDEIVDSLSQLVEIRSTTGSEGDAVRYAAAKMEELGYDEARVDTAGNVIGRIGSGPRVLVFDAHLDVVDAEPGDWATPPFTAVVKDNCIYGRGTMDDKGPFVCTLFAGHLIKRLGLCDDLTIYVIGSVAEEECEGLALGMCIEELGIIPDAVVIAESSELELRRGHRGRALISATFEGRSVHASNHHEGVNPIELATPFLAALTRLDAGYPETEPLGRGSIVAVDVDIASNSRSSVPRRATVYLDRRTTTADTHDSVLSELRALPNGAKCKLDYVQWEAEGYNGCRLAGEEYFPAWALDPDHRLVMAGKAAYKRQNGRDASVTTWGFSTNGNYTMGRKGYPTIGFGPGQMSLAHGANEHIRIDDLLAGTTFYAELAREINTWSHDG